MRRKSNNPRDLKCEIFLFDKYPESGTGSRAAPVTTDALRPKARFCTVPWPAPDNYSHVSVQAAFERAYELGFRNFEIYTESQENLKTDRDYYAKEKT